LQETFLPIQSVRLALFDLLPHGPRKFPKPYEPLHGRPVTLTLRRKPGALWIGGDWFEQVSVNPKSDGEGVGARSSGEGQLGTEKKSSPVGEASDGEGSDSDGEGSDSGSSDGSDESGAGEGSTSDEEAVDGGGKAGRDLKNLDDSEGEESSDEGRPSRKDRAVVMEVGRRKERQGKQREETSDESSDDSNGSSDEEGGPDGKSGDAMEVGGSKVKDRAGGLDGSEESLDKQGRPSDQRRDAVVKEGGGKKRPPPEEAYDPIDLTDEERRRLERERKAETKRLRAKARQAHGLDPEESSDDSDESSDEDWPPGMTVRDAAMCDDLDESSDDDKRPSMKARDVAMSDDSDESSDEDGRPSMKAYYAAMRDDSDESSDEEGRPSAKGRGAAISDNSDESSDEDRRPSMKAYYAAMRDDSDESSDEEGRPSEKKRDLLAKEGSRKGPQAGGSDELDGSSDDSDEESDWEDLDEDLGGDAVGRLGGRFGNDLGKGLEVTGTGACEAEACGQPNQTGTLNSVSPPEGARSSAEMGGNTNTNLPRHNGTGNGEGCLGQESLPNALSADGKTLDTEQDGSPTQGFAPQGPAACGGGVADGGPEWGSDFLAAGSKWGFDDQALPLHSESAGGPAQGDGWENEGEGGADNESRYWGVEDVGETTKEGGREKESQPGDGESGLLGEKEAVGTKRKGRGGEKETQAEKRRRLLAELEGVEAEGLDPADLEGLKAAFVECIAAEGGEESGEGEPLAGKKRPRAKRAAKGKASGAAKGTGKATGAGKAKGSEKAKGSGKAKKSAAAAEGAPAKPAKKKRKKGTPPSREPKYGVKRVNVKNKALAAPAVEGWAGIQNDLLIEIMSKADPKLTVVVSAVCKSWKRVCMSEDMWAHHYQRKFGTLPKAKPLNKGGRSSMSWLAAFVQVGGCFLFLALGGAFSEG
jgi:hypothetical protein